VAEDFDVPSAEAPASPAEGASNAGGGCGLGSGLALVGLALMFLQAPRRSRFADRSAG
jgi:hypothetical protein